MTIPKMCKFAIQHPAHAQTHWLVIYGTRDDAYALVQWLTEALRLGEGDLMQPIPFEVYGTLTEEE